MSLITYGLVLGLLFANLFIEYLLTYKKAVTDIEFFLLYPQKFFRTIILNKKIYILSFLIVNLLKLILILLLWFFVKKPTIIPIIYLIVIIITGFISMILIPYRMNYINRDGELYSERGLRFGGVETSFLEENFPDFIRYEIIGMAYFWAVAPRNMFSLSFSLFLLLSHSLIISILGSALIMTLVIFSIYFESMTFRIFATISISRAWESFEKIFYLIAILSFVNVNPKVSIIFFIFAILQSFGGLISIVFDFITRKILNKVFKQMLLNYTNTYEMFALYRIMSFYFSYYSVP